MIEIDTNDYVFDIIPNETLVEHFAINDVDSEKYNDWLQSNQTWQDSLTIFDSVIIVEHVFFDESQIIECS